MLFRSAIVAAGRGDETAGRERTKALGHACGKAGIDMRQLETLEDGARRRWFEHARKTAQARRALRRKQRIGLAETAGDDRRKRPGGNGRVGLSGRPGIALVAMVDVWPGLRPLLEPVADRIAGNFRLTRYLRFGWLLELKMQGSRCDQGWRRRSAEGFEGTGGEIRQTQRCHLKYAGPEYSGASG